MLGNSMRGGLARVCVVIAVLLAVAAPAAAQGTVGVILMHGKQGSPNTPGLRDIASKAQAAGMKVVVPSMPWGSGGWEKINVTPDQVFAMIDGYANQLRAQGAQRIVVGGHSLGANMALAYAVARQNVAGVVMAAPGHSPVGSYRNPSIKDSIDQAAQLVKSGQASQPFSGLDENQGSSIRMSTTAGVYAAWLNPRGQASMPVQAPLLPASIPVMVIIGTKDPGYGYIENSVYKPAAKNPYSKFLVIDGGDHRNTDQAASQRIVDWIKGLP
jgi:pimeloyl-ACP methyl ester carboxylesterase